MIDSGSVTMGEPSEMQASEINVKQLSIFSPKSQTLFQKLQKEITTKIDSLNQKKLVEELFGEIGFETCDVF